MTPAPRAPRILVVGLRGFPGVQGGVETHVEHLLPRIAAAGMRVSAVVRTRYMPATYPPDWRGVRYVRLWAPGSTGLEAIVHTLLAVLYASVTRPDVLHFQAIGPSLWAPLARLVGLRVVVTNHGPDYDRQKWGAIAKWVLRLSERAGVLAANEYIVISEAIQRAVQRQYGRSSSRIPNGVVPAGHVDAAPLIAPFGLEAGRYLLLVSRLVPEKRHIELIEAFSRANMPGWKLAIVGGADHSSDYSRQVAHVAATTPGVVMTGFQRGEALAALLSGAGCFVLPSSHEGLPIALLEALSHGLRVLASDIPANLEVGLDAESYFPVGNVTALTESLNRIASLPPLGEAERSRIRTWTEQRFSWDDVARSTAEIYRRVTSGK